MRLGYNTNGLQNHRLEDALDLLAEHGYRAVALTLDVQHLDPFHATAAEVQRIAEQLRTLDLQPVIETGARFLLDPRAKHEPTLMTRDPEARARRLEFYARASAIGRDLGARVLSFWSGIDRQPDPDSTAWLHAGVVATVERVRARGLQPALEPEPGMTIATLTDYAEICAGLGEAAPRLCLDVGHLYVTGESEPAAAIEEWGHRLAQVHLEDMRRGVHEHLPPGEGDVDFTAVRAALQAADYRGAVCFELSRSSHMGPAALEICRRAWQSSS